MHQMVGRFDGPAHEVRRNAFHATFELPLVEETEAGREECNDGGRLVLCWRERRRSPGLVVVLEEAGEFALIVEFGAKMLAYRSRVAIAQPVVETLVICVVEALLQ